MFKAPLLILILATLLTGIAFAEEINQSKNTSTFIGDQTYSGYLIPIVQAQNGTPLPVYNTTLHIENGDCVPINSTVDISSLGWGVPRLSYYGVYYDGFSADNSTPKYSIDLPNTASKLKNFYIDPYIFGNRTGYWYQTYDNDQKETAGNLRMFKVQFTCPVPETQSELKLEIEQVNTTLPQQKSYLPEKRAADILIARGDELAVIGGYDLNWYMFGYGDGQQILDQKSTDGIIVLDTNSWTLETGNYHLVKIGYGQNQILEESYSPEYKPEKYSNYTYPALVSPFRNGTINSISGLNPQNVENILKQMVKGSIDDNLSVWNVQYSEPEIQIMRIDALKNPDNQTWYNIRGYTNVINGTKLSVTIDKGSYFYKMNKTWSADAVAISNDPGVWREFNVLIPVDYKNMFPGPHYITVSCPQGGSMTVPFYIYKELAPHYIPDETVEYFGVSPYVTPEIITKTVTRTVTVQIPGPVQTITPSESDWDNYVAAQHRVIIGETVAGILIAIAIGILIYFGYVIIRSRRRT